MDFLFKLAVILYIVCQGAGWLFPQVYGSFDAMREKAYMESAERIGLWAE